MSSINYKNSNSGQKFISLKAASQLFGYTRDHLGLMIRRGKLRAERLGNYYFTTHEWVEDYVKNHASLNHPKLKHKLSNHFRTELLGFASKDTNSVANISSRSTSSMSDKSNLSILSNLSSSFSLSKKGGLPAGNRKDEPTKLNKEEATFMPIPFSNLISSGPQDPHLIILPIRKMDNSARERILRELNL